MILALTLALVITAAGALATYIYDEGASLGARLCTGACVGLAGFGLIAFVLALVLGLTPPAIALATLLSCAPFLLLLDDARREGIVGDLDAFRAAVRHSLSRPTLSLAVYVLFYAGLAVLIYLLFDRAMMVRSDGIYTGVLNNFGDLPFHLSVVSGFAFGNNYPPEDPTYAGVRFTYPFLSDFISAVFVRCGASLRASLFIENFFLAVGFVGVLHRWAWEMLRDRIAALITPLIVLLNGGFGFSRLFSEAPKNQRGLWGVLTQLPPSFTVIPETTWRWGNAFSSLLLTQRGILLGLPLAVIVFTQWWLATLDEESDALRENRNRAKPAVRGKKEKRQDWGAQKLKAQESYESNASTASGFIASMLGSTRVRRMIAGGLIAGLLPLVHAHTFLVIVGVGGCLALWLNAKAWLAVGTLAGLLLLSIMIVYPGAITELNVTVIANSVLIKGLVVIGGLGLVVALWFLLETRQRNLWFSFFIAALLIAVPQMLWSTTGSAVNAKNFFAWELGWDHGKDNPVLFWFENTGIFIPLLVTAILWRGHDYLVPRRLLLFYLPFTLCFIVPNVVKMAPWIWDNVKVLFYWWLASAPLVALLLSRLWRLGSWQRVLAAAFLVCLTLSGALDVASIVSRSSEYQLFDPFGVKFAEVIKEQTEPRSTVVHAPVHNTPVFLTGRRSLMGYPGHIWTHGLVFSDREAEIKRIYAGAPDAEMLLKKYDVDYAVVGPLERMVMPVNEQFFTRFQKVGQSGDYRLYKITR